MRRDEACLSSQWKMAPSNVDWSWLMVDFVMWLVTCWVCSDHKWWHNSEMLACGMEGRPFFFVQVLMASFIWLKYSFLDVKTLFNKEPSAITASSGGRSEWRREPDNTQWGAEGLSAAVLYSDQDLQQHVAGLDVDQSSIACLWLQRMSRTAECLIKTVLKEGVWQGIWWSNIWKCHWRRNFFSCYWRFGERDQGALKADALGAGFPCHHLMVASMAVRDNVRKGSWVLLASRRRA